MNIFLLYLVLLKGTVTAFAGLASLPVVQNALVFQYHVLTNQQLNEAIHHAKHARTFRALCRRRWLLCRWHSRRDCRMGGHDNASIANNLACTFCWPQT
jgi:hypothetical protein